MMITEEQMAIFRTEQSRSQADGGWVREIIDWRAERSSGVIGGLLEHLSSFLNGSISLREFQGTFDKKSRTTWDIMGLKAMSGAMFLNTIVKHAPDQSAASAALKRALPRPENSEIGLEQMTEFAGFIDGLVESHVITRSQVQAARIPYFLSAWWQLQDREMWPVYYNSMRQAFVRHGVWKQDQLSPTQSYFAFRAVALQLGVSLELDVWGVEALCLWMERPIVTGNGIGDNVIAPPYLGDSTKPSVNNDSQQMEITLSVVGASPHTEVQWLLAELGKHFGFNVWIAQNDHSREWKGHKLGELSVPTLPSLGIGDAAQSVIRLIDVIWLKGASQVIAAFEVEYTTSIYSGLLRMSDLAVLAPNTNFPIYIVAPAIKIDKVRAQLRRPTFQTIELHRRCQFFSIEQFMNVITPMLQWATSASAIDKIAERVADVDESIIPAADAEDENP